MPLTQEQATAAAAALRTKLRGCPICGARNWQIVDIITTLPYHEGGLVIGGPTIPTLVVVCDKCQYLASFSAVALGLVQPRTRESK